MKRHRPIHEIAYDIHRDWKKPNYGAIPYLEVMMILKTIEDKYYSDSAKTIIVYFLSNASTYRGDKARVFKQELKEIINDA